MHCAGTFRSIWMVWVVAALCMFVAGCAKENPRQAIGRKIYDFPANLDRAKLKTSSFPFVNFALNTLARDQSDKVSTTDRGMVNFGQEFTINNDKRKVLYEHPFSEILFENVEVPANAVLHFGIGIHPGAWTKRGDGVSFEISVVSANSKSAKTMIFAEYLDPKNRSRDRKWFDYDLDLSAYSGQTVSFIFATDAGPQNDSRDDWAGWSDLQIVLKAHQR